MRVPLVVGVIGRMVQLFSLALLVPALVALVDRAWMDVGRFLASALLAFAWGSLANWGFKPPRVFYRAEALAVVSGTWLTVGIFASVPYVLSGLGPVDAIFESISGLTTTGATILRDFTVYGRAFFLWRAMTQWFGGLGIIALFVVVLPRLGIAGRQLFFAESSSAPGEAISPQIRQAANMLWKLYIALTVICTVALALTGMPLWDALLNALTTLPAGGFSPNGASIAGYQNPAAEWVLVVFMFLAGASFPLQVKAFTGRLSAFWRDSEFMVYLGVTVAGALAAAAFLAGGLPDPDALRAGFFQSASLISSTGFASEDYNLWNWQAKIALVAVMIVGGCAGSAAGGPKVVRHLLVFRHIRREIRQVLHPRAVLPLLYNGRHLPMGVMRAVFALAALYITGYLAVGMLLVAMGYDPVTSFSASLACLGNIGPGFEAVGPMANFADFDPFSKLALTAAMWIGRLEIVTVLALLHPDVWRGLRLRSR